MPLFTSGGLGLGLKNLVLFTSLINMVRWEMLSTSYEFEDTVIQNSENVSLFLHPCTALTLLVVSSGWLITNIWPITTTRTAFSLLHIRDFLRGFCWLVFCFRESISDVYLCAGMVGWWVCWRCQGLLVMCIRVCRDGRLMGVLEVSRSIGDVYLCVQGW